MRHTIELDREDIVKIIAEHFDADEDQVSLTVRSVSRGWGEAEHDEYVVYGTVIKE